MEIYMRLVPVHRAIGPAFLFANGDNHLHSTPFKKMMKVQWHQLEISTIQEQLDTVTGAGLTQAQAADRLATTGPNELQEKGRKSPWRILWEQVSSVMVMILILAALVSAFLGKVTETAAGQHCAR